MVQTVKTTMIADRYVSHIHLSYWSREIILFSSKETCRERKNAYIARKIAKYEAEVSELKMQQVRAWDGVRVYRLLSRTPFPSYESVVKNVVNPLSPEESRRLHYILRD